MSPSAETRRPDNLALVFQETLTAIERLRAGRQAVSDAEAFRAQMRDAMRNAANNAMAAGYNVDDVKFVTLAVVAFLDESILNSQIPAFADWPRKPLQEELFGTHVAGETFFQHLQQLLSRGDSPELADVLEVYYLCMVLGFGGRYSIGGRGELHHILHQTAEKMRRIRGRTMGPLSPAGLPQRETVRAQNDPWIKRLTWIAGGSALLVVLLFVLYRIVLASGVRA